MTPEQLVELLSVGAGIARLDGARCKGRPERFDLDIRSDRESIDWAVFTCGACPALQKCATWLDGLEPRQRPAGVVAATLIDDGAYQTAKAAMLAERKPAPLKEAS
ncbi:hypothetical protein OCO_15560 [Mycobacterium intracellulare MOTT-02]|uniref:hypothetical protein n=1 Tax=Mycobacterium intracellulare TaxID=1767 RepID=UPI0002529637|nr:hypothetical protein [Mycobacterium intracellulare]AFC47919.1 hypothetical protein OCO_15560 [Mycobacterium intracellulare MOTT-02]MDM3896662.1 hypothetical protein [Mycobacterium intracellulare]BCP36188.1 hypothetical protein MINTMi198_15580 [Mycobacterium intracellulare M.i.198]